MLTSPLLIVATGFGLSLLLSLGLVQFARRTGFAMDDPAQHTRRIHRAPTARIGGLALLLAYGLALWWFLPAGMWQNQQVQGLAVGTLLITLLGVIDDVRSLSGRVKLVGELLIISFVVIHFELLVPYANNPLGGILRFPPWFSAAISIIWILGTTNTLNFIDGIDGLATSVAISFAIVVGVVALLFDQAALAIILAALLGCCLGFLPVNWHRARSFLGDGGAMFLGFTIGTLSILSGAKLATTLLVLGLPILDILNTFWVRFRRGQSLFTADNEHLHYRLIRKGLSTGQTVLVIAGISFGFGLLALANNTTFKVISLAVLLVVSQLLILWSQRR